MAAAEISEKSCGMDEAAHIGGMGAHEGARIVPEQSLQKRKLHLSYGIRRDPCEADTLASKLHEGAHHGVMLQGGDENMISFLQEALQNEV